MSTQTFKYPRTPHLPGSPGMTEDDKRISAAGLATLRDGRELVVTEKMDGGNLTWYRDAFHGRSLDSGTHAWDTAARALWAQVRFDIPEGWRISGESMWARRSVPYDDLPGVYIVFGIWDEQQVLRPWDETVEWAQLLGLPTAPVLYRGTDWDAATSAWRQQREEDSSEGFVVRDAGAFPQSEFGLHIAKWVRAGHVRTRDDWRHRDDFATNTFL
jgi:hypothetical protein